MQIGLLSYRHLPQVMDIETRAYPWPWTEGMFADSLRSGHLCYLASEREPGLQQDLERALGYIIVLVAVGECHVLNVCVDPQQQGNGYGRRLLNHALNAAVDLGAEAAYLEVRASNETAIKLYESAGFERVGLRKQYYPAGDVREDALVYRLALPHPQR